MVLPLRNATCGLSFFIPFVPFYLSKKNCFVCIKMVVLKSGSPADLRKFMDKKLEMKLNGNRHIIGLLRGYDNFMNIVLENTIEVTKSENKEIGTVIIRGNSILMWECLDKIKV